MVLIFCILSLNLFVFYNCQDVFVAKKNNTYFCVTNSSSALIWIVESTHLTASRYVSEQFTVFSNESPRNRFDSKISSDSRTRINFIRKPWYLIRNYLHFCPVFDRRWEDLGIFLTTAKNSTPNYLKLATINWNNFELNFSVRTKYDANFFLCNGGNITSSSCYWFTLEGSQGNTSTVKRCDEISDVSELNCTLIKEQMHLSRKILTEDSWSHFQVSKKRSVISVKVLDNSREKTVLEIDDDKYKVNSMFVYSNSVNAFWKIHTITSLYTKEESKDVNMGSSIPVDKDYVCVSMIVSMCSHCLLKLKFWSSSFQREETFTTKANFEWFEIKFLADRIPLSINYTYLYVSTVSNSSYNQTGTWYIDEVRLCQVNESRLISSSEKTSCQLISEKTQIVSLDSPEQTSFSEECAEDTIGPFCFPCTSIFQNCDGIQVCTEKCWCSAGSRNLPDCTDSCPLGSYGLGCSLSCDHCFDFRCNVKTGVCPSCSQRYIGPKCDRTQLEPISNAEIFWAVNENVATMELSWDQVLTRENTLDGVGISIFNMGTNVFNRTIRLSSDYDYFHHRYSVDVKFLPSTLYTVNIIVDNIYSTQRTNITDKSPPAIPVLRSKKCFGSENTITLMLEPRDRFYDAIVLISENSGTTYSHPSLRFYESLLRLDLSRYRQIHSLHNFSKDTSIVIGNGDFGTRNFPLASNTSYGVCLILSSSNNAKTSNSVVFLKCATTVQHKNSNFFLLFLLLVVPVVMLVAYLLYRKMKYVSLSVSRSDETLETQNINLVEMTQSNLNTNLNNRRHQNPSSYLEMACPSMVIPKNSFQQYLKDCDQNGDLERQFQIIDSNKKIYDEVEGNSFFHYVDMTYVNGSVISKAYLLTEVPKSEKVENFWKYVFEGNVKRIVLLSEKNEDVLSYCPQQTEMLTFNHLRVQLLREQFCSSYKYNVFLLTNGQEQKQVDQIQFSYNGSNAKKYVPFFKKLMENNLTENSPVLIHSSGSKKRIGFVVLCDMSLRTAKEEEVTDVLKNFKRLMDQVAHVVDDLELYKRCYSVISEFIFEDELAATVVKIYNSFKKSKEK